MLSVVSYWSYRAARQSLEFEEEKSSFEATPALTESLDSVYVHFSSNNENSELQFLQINFPDSFSDRLITLNTKPLKVNKFELELLAINYLKHKIAVNDSTSMAGQMALPVLMDYNVVVYRRSFNLRENRLLLYTFVLSNDYSKVTFTNSFLTKRFGFPIKKQFHWKIPFTDLEGDRIVAQDKIDVENLLNAQFYQLEESLKKETYD